MLWKIRHKTNQRHCDFSSSILWDIKLVVQHNLFIENTRCKQRSIWEKSMSSIDSPPRPIPSIFFKRLNDIVPNEHIGKNQVNGRWCVMVLVCRAYTSTARVYDISYIFTYIPRKHGARCRWHEREELVHSSICTISYFVYTHAVRSRGYYTPVHSVHLSALPSHKTQQTTMIHTLGRRHLEALARHDADGPHLPFVFFFVSFCHAMPCMVALVDAGTGFGIPPIRRVSLSYTTQPIITNFIFLLLTLGVKGLMKRPCMYRQCRTIVSIVCTCMYAHIMFYVVCHRCDFSFFRTISYAHTMDHEFSYVFFLSMASSRLF